MAKLKGFDRVSPYTPWFIFVEGAYRLGGEVVPYYSTTMQVKEAKKFLSLAQDVVFSASGRVTLEELFQRDLEEDRIRDEIVPYLKTPGRIKFFNALTIALLPADPERPGALASQYAEDKSPPKADGDDVRQVGAVQFEFADDAPGGSYGRLRWNTNLIRPVVLDGQHRFCALRTLYDEQGYSGRGQVGETEIPIIALVPATDTGLLLTGEVGNDPLRICRAIFIDLNKHAKEVSKARQYLLDDRDLTAVAMRSILAQEIGAHQHGPIAERVRESCRLPLSIVDWHSGKAKFDDGIYVTSLFNLYDLTSVVLDLPPFPKSDDYDAADKFIDRLASRLRTKELRTALQKLKEECMAQQIPFDLRSQDINAAIGAFRSEWGSLMTRPFVELIPYAELIHVFEQKGILNSVQENWCALDEKGKEAFERETSQMPGLTARPLAKTIKQNYPLAFQVVYQKAFVRVLIEMEGAAQELLSTWQPENPVKCTRDVFVTSWIERFNAQVVPSLLADNVDLWLAAGRTLDKNIDFTQRGIRSIAGLACLAMLAPLNSWHVTDADTLKNESVQWVNSAWAKIKKGQKATKIDHLLSSHGKEYRDSVSRFIIGQYAIDHPEPMADDRLKRQMVSFAADKLARMAVACQHKP